MMPESKELWEEGLQVTSMKIVSGGVFLEDAARQAFEEAGSRPGCSPTRRIQDNLSDLKAKISANQRGITLLDMQIVTRGPKRREEYVLTIFFGRNNSKFLMIQHTGRPQPRHGTSCGESSSPYLFLASRPTPNPDKSCEYVTQTVLSEYEHIVFFWYILRLRLPLQ